MKKIILVILTCLSITLLMAAPVNSLSIKEKCELIAKGDLSIYQRKLDGISVEDEIKRIETIEMDEDSRLIGIEHIRNIYDALPYYVDELSREIAKKTLFETSKETCIERYINEKY